MKVLFPFRGDRPSLRNKWWHRLFIVIFVLLLFAIPTIVYYRMNNAELNERKDCLSTWTNYNLLYADRFHANTEQEMTLGQNKPSMDISTYNAERQRLKQEWDDINKDWKRNVQMCYDTYPINTTINIGLALLTLVVVWYLSQLLYYRIFIYIVLGENKK